jgi:poly(glycerol-phosphate) alpha-glucosyltransferase
VLIGPDTNGYQANLKSLASGPGKIFFAGPQFGLDKEGWLRAADFCVLPSTTEGFPMAALEYMAHAKPVVMTKACNMPELAMVGAALQADGGEESLRSCLSAMMALSDAERADMGQQGLRLAMDRYTWSRVVDELAEVYAWILGKRGIPPTIRLD